IAIRHALLDLERDGTQRESKRDLSRVCELDDSVWEIRDFVEVFSVRDQHTSTKEVTRIASLFLQVLQRLAQTHYRNSVLAQAHHSLKRNHVGERVAPLTPSAGPLRRHDGRLHDSTPIPVIETAPADL